MKIVFRGTNTADISAVKSVTVSASSNKIEVLVKHKTEKQDKEKVSALPDPRKMLTEDLANIVGEELKSLIQAPDMPIDQIIGLKSWSHGYLAVPFERNDSGDEVVVNDTPVLALARLCWWWPTRQAPTDKQLELRMQMSIEEITKISEAKEYAGSVQALMHETYNPTEFKEWAKSFRNTMPERLGTWMRLSEETIVTIRDSVAKAHGVDLDEKKETKKADAPKDDQQEWEVFWGCYKEPDSTKFRPFGRVNVEAPSLARAKTLATQELNDWVGSEVEEPDEVEKARVLEAQKEMKTGLGLNKGKWEDGQSKSNKVIGTHSNVWSGLFLRVRVAK